ncbi:5-deoxy-glucuronate isomerase [Anaerovorax odorimutans]|uniref:5-deoxy-glucuronate isomerase n=1 Tax=Anaerovorax odorimutans TaxID=109327 RepID=A0ABT1RP43_9FIRM|nr:5-deoxy-glucuronate isomerase [Anaerovorax odorimutans]MCQ4636964.1 5-deoxy-glucuronate isomerase [Anaerovorax odorimutans]
MLLRLPKIKEGYTTVTDMNGTGADMLMDIGIQKILAGKTVEFSDSEKETAFLLLEGAATFQWEGKKILAERKSLLDEGPSVLHVSKNTKVKISAGSDVELLIQKTDNEKEFASKFYTPDDCVNGIFGDGVWDNTARRTVRTVFDLSNAPYSNMVMGEIINYPGKWSSYIPHGHDQPEVYYYRFEREEGFGAAFIGEETFKIVDNSALCIPGGPTHPQAAAPGYPMWYCWMIRHLDGNPWDKRVSDPRYEWLLEDDVKIWSPK